MPVRLKPDGTYEFDSVEEAVAYAKLIAGSATSLPQQTASHNGAEESREPAPKAGAMDRFMREASGNVLAIVKAVCEADGPLLTEEVAARSGLSTGQIGPVIRHIRSGMAKYGVKPTALMTKTKVKRESDNKATAQYRVKDDARRIWRAIHQAQ